MNTFCVYDYNKPKQFFVDCVGCILKPGHREGHPDVLQVVSASGGIFDVGIPLPHALADILYEKIVRVSELGGKIIIPDFAELNDDEIRVAIDQVKVGTDQQ